VKLVAFGISVCCGPVTGARDFWVAQPCPVGRNDGELWGAICPDILNWITGNIPFGKMALYLLSAIHILERYSPSLVTINSSSSLPWCLMEKEIGFAEPDTPESFVCKGGVTICLCS
jgi:hypothetical protein